MGMMGPRIVVIGGTDGVGKSTLVAKLMRDSWGDWNVSNIKHRSIFDANPRLVEMISRDGLNEYLKHLDPTARFLFCLHAIRQSISDLTADDVVLYDGYWYKYAARELAARMPVSMIKAAEILLPKPAAILHIHLAPEIAAQRRASYSVLERGGATASPDQASFIRFQSRVQDQWQNINQHITDIPFYAIDGALSMDAVHQTAHRHLCEIVREKFL